MDIADTPTTAVAAPADNQTGLNYQQQTALAVGTIIIFTFNSIQNLNYFKFDKLLSISFRLASMSKLFELLVDSNFKILMFHAESVFVHQANDTAQAAVDMQNWAQMTSQMDTYLR